MGDNKHIILLPIETFEDIYHFPESAHNESEDNEFQSEFAFSLNSEVWRFRNYKINTETNDIFKCYKSSVIKLQKNHSKESIEIVFETGDIITLIDGGKIILNLSQGKSIRLVELTVYDDSRIKKLVTEFKDKSNILI